MRREFFTPVQVKSKGHQRRKLPACEVFVVFFRISFRKCMYYCAERRWSISENNRLISIKKDAVLNMPSHGARQHDLFEITAFTDEVFDRIAV
jgi:hypothetical protein